MATTVPNDFDTGSILGNLFNDIKHIPERTLQQSRSLRASSKMQAIEDQRRRQQELGDKLAGVGLSVSDFPDEKSAIAAYLPKLAGITRNQGLLDHIASYRQGLKEKADELGVAPDPDSGDPAQAAAPATPMAPPSASTQSPMAPLDSGDPGSDLPTPAAIPLAQRIRQAATAAELAKAKQDDQNRTDILAKEKRSLIGEQQKDKFGSIFGRLPQGEEVDADGNLTPVGLNAIYAGSQKKSNGFEADPEQPGAWRPVPGGPADIKAQADAAKAKAQQDGDDAKKRMADESRQSVLDNIDKAIPLVGATTAGTRLGLGGIADKMYQPSRDLHASLEAIKSGLGVDMLNQMRASSKTGSTGIGRIMQVEFDAFSKSLRNLDQAQSPEALKKNLSDLKEHFSTFTKLQQQHQDGGTSGGAFTPAPAAKGPVKILSITPVQ